MNRRRRQPFGRAAQVTSLAALTGSLTLSFVLDMTADWLGALGWSVQLTVTAVAIIVGLVLWAVRYRWPSGGDDKAPLAPSLPPVVDLVGRDGVIDAVTEKAAAHGIVVVHGPAGIGGSSVAISAARRLVPAEPNQWYVDLRGVRPDDARSARMHVLRTLVPEIDGSERHAARAVVGALRRSRGPDVLLIDNVTGVRQVIWIARAVPGAYIVIVGEMKIEELPVAAVPVQGLEPADALTLLRRQDIEPPPTRAARIRDRVLGVRRHSIDARIAAEQDAANALAAQYLRHPRVVIQLGRWLARNPQVRISRLRHDLDRGGVVSELRMILRETLTGASPGARRLLTLLVTLPEVEYPDTAMAALAGVPVERAAEQLTELGERFLVHRTSSGSRVVRQAAHLTEPVPARTAAQARTRLTEYYANLAEANADLLTGPHHAEAGRWFAAQDVTLRALLGMAEPPRRAAPHLWAIADALDVWFTRDARQDDRHATARTMREQAGKLNDTAAEAIALVRLAAIERRRSKPGKARELLDLADTLGHGRVPWMPQLRTESALCYAATGDLDAARNELLRCRQARPQRDLEGRMIDLINLAVTDIRAGRHGSAIGPLDEAARLADRVNRPAGRAQARELAGVALHAQGRVRAAEKAWTDAETSYRSIGDRVGQGRCARRRSVLA